MLTLCWVATCGTFFLLIIFIKYLPGDTYMTGVAMGFSCLGYLSSDYVTSKFGVFNNLISGYATTTILIAVILLLN